MSTNPTHSNQDAKANPTPPSDYALENALNRILDRVEQNEKRVRMLLWWGGCSLLLTLIVITVQFLVVQKQMREINRFNSPMGMPVPSVMTTPNAQP